MNDMYGRITMITTNIRLIVFILWEFSLSSIFGNTHNFLPAFPGAEGFGSSTPGGRGGEVFVVNSLDDTYNLHDSEHTLREALEYRRIDPESGRVIPRIVVFSVGGMVNLVSRISINKPYLTIAGQTAPGSGICIRLADSVPALPIIDMNVHREQRMLLRVNSHDIVIRHLRLRPGSGNADTHTSIYCDYVNCITINDAQNVVIDHCSMSWSPDINLIIYREGGQGSPKDISIQWCTITQALQQNKHPKGNHSMGVLIYSEPPHRVNPTRITFHHNLFAYNQNRNPQCGVGGLYEIANNCIFFKNGHSPLSHLTALGQPLYLNYIKNYIETARNLEGTSSVLYGRSDSIYVCINGNRIRDDDLTLVTGTVIKSKKHDTEPITEFRATIARELVLRQAGATLPVRDIVDRTIIRDVSLRRGNFLNAVGITDKCIHHQAYVLAESPSPKQVVLNFTWHKHQYESKQYNLSTYNGLVGYYIKILKGSGMGPTLHTIVSHELDSYVDPLNPNDTHSTILVQVDKGWSQWLKPKKNSLYQMICPTDKYTLAWPRYPEEHHSVNYDKDRDGMADWWEKIFNVDEACADNDGDGYSNIEEFINGTLPNGMIDIPGDSKMGVSPLWISKVEITQNEYCAITQRVRAFAFLGRHLPVEQCTYYDAIIYCNERSKIEDLDTIYVYANEHPPEFNQYGNCINLQSLTIDMTKNGYRLPTTKEWSYAYSAGTTTKYYWGERFDDSYVWGGRNSKNKTHCVATKKPNQWGLYDMAGNVEEWTHGQEQQVQTVGGAYNIRNHAAFEATVFKRASFKKKDHYTSNIGFRVVRSRSL